MQTRKLAVVFMLVASFGLAQQPGRPPTESHITIINADGTSKKIIYSSARNFETPNWSPDGKYLVLNSQGKLWRLAVDGGEPEAIDTGSVSGLNNDHGISPDGKLLAISTQQIYILPFAGGEPRQITEKKPSYYHGWSPDGKTLVYCAQRDQSYNLYSISVQGGPETRLTAHPGNDDGPEYSPDGKWVYFNSNRSGSMDIWRIPADGAGPDDSKAERITSDEYEDQCPHPSPDGKWLVFISYQKGTKGHPPNRDVLLRMMPLPGRKLAPAGIKTMDSFLGGQGSMSTNSWAPDGKRFAYVTYSLPK